MGRPGAGTGGSGHSAGGTSRPSGGGGHRASASGGGHQVRQSSHTASAGSRPTGAGFNRGTASHRASTGSHSKPPRSSYGSHPNPEPPRGGYGSHLNPEPPRGDYGRHPDMGPHYGGGGYPPPPPPNRSRGYHHEPTHTGGGRANRGPSGGCLVPAIIILIVIGLLLVFGIGGCSGIPVVSSLFSKNTVQRQPLETSQAYIDDCIIDELGWFEDEKATEAQLRDFWKETGVQPYILMKSYDPALTSTTDKEQWAVDYYDTNFDADNIFLYVYFAEEDADNEVGYMAYAVGTQAATIMDTQAVDVFWDNMDRYWYQDGSLDDVMVKTFDNTADTIMKETSSALISGEDAKAALSKTGKVLKTVLIVLLIIGAVIVIGVIVIIIVSLRANREREKAAEQQKILETPLEDMIEDELEKKYLNQDSEE